MDSSLSTRESNFQRQKDFVNIMASSLNVGPEKSHLGVIVFSNEATLSIKFNEQADLFAFQNAVQSIPYNAGSSHIDKALFVASQQLFAPSGGMRPEVNKVLVLITDGKQTLAPDAPPPQIALDALRQKAVRIYLIGVGDDLDHQWLRQLVQRDQDLMIAYDFKELFNRTRQVAQKICDLTVTPAGDVDTLILFYLKHLFVFVYLHTICFDVIQVDEIHEIVNFENLLCDQLTLRLPHASRFFVVEPHIFCRNQIGLKFVGPSVLFDDRN